LPAASADIDPQTTDVNREITGSRKPGFGRSRPLLKTNLNQQANSISGGKQSAGDAVCLYNDDYNSIFTIGFIE
jgi:hypothetical protein